MPAAGSIAKTGRRANGSVSQRPSYDQRIRLAHNVSVLVVVVELGKQVTHGVDAGTLLVVAFDHYPRRGIGIGRGKHFLLRRGVVVPSIHRLHIRRGKLPLPYRVYETDGEPRALFRR